MLMDILQCLSLEVQRGNMNHKVFIIGAGGHAKVIVSTVLAAGIEITGIYDDNQEKWGGDVLGIPVRGPISSIKKSQDINAIIAIGDNKTRKAIADKLDYVRWISIIHPEAYVHTSVRLGEGSVVFAKAIIQPDTVIGNHCIVNTGSTIDHDCTIGNYVHIAPGVNLAGEVCLEEGVFCGIGSKAITGIKIGKWTTIGAGGVVVNDLPEGSIAVGIPAKVIGNE